MFKKRSLRRLVAVALTAILALSGGATAFAESSTVDIDITRFELQTLDHETATELFQSDTFYLAMNWDASKNGSNIHEGDYFDVTLPDNMRFPSSTTASSFDLTDEAGTVIAHATVTPGANDTGGSVHVVFTNAVENKYNVKGTMYLAAQFDETKISTDQENTFSITVNGKVAGHSSAKETGVVITGSKPLDNEV